MELLGIPPNTNLCPHRRRGLCLQTFCLSVSTFPWGQSRIYLSFFGCKVLFGFLWIYLPISFKVSFTISARNFGVLSETIPGFLLLSGGHEEWARLGFATDRGGDLCLLRSLEEVLGSHLSSFMAANPVYYIR